MKQKIINNCVSRDIWHEIFAGDPRKPWYLNCICCACINLNWVFPWFRNLIMCFNLCGMIKNECDVIKYCNQIYAPFRFIDGNWSTCLCILDSEDAISTFWEWIFFPVQLPLEILSKHQFIIGFSELWLEHHFAKYP